MTATAGQVAQTDPPGTPGTTGPTALTPEALLVPDTAVERRLPVQDQVALGDLQLRKEVTKWVLALFAVTNLVVIGFIVYAFVQETSLIRAKASGYAAYSVVTNGVVMALIAATAAQLGAVLFAVATYLFPNRGGQSGGPPSGD